MNRARRQGLVKLTVSAGAGALLTQRVPRPDNTAWLLWAFAPGLVLVIALAGCIELVAGLPFMEMQRRWNSLGDVQQGLVWLIILGGIGTACILWLRHAH